MFRNNLALGHIVNDVDAGSNEQKINKASSSNNIDLRIVFRIIDSLRDELNLIYIKERQINPQSNPKGAGRKAYDICFMFKLLTIQSVLVDLCKSPLGRFSKRYFDDAQGMTPDSNHPERS